MEQLKNELITLGTTVGGRVLYAVVVLIVGVALIKLITKSLSKLDSFKLLEPSMRTFLKSLIRILLYVILIIAVISILGIPTASILAVLASAGLAVGLSLQGALSNLAGGIMIMFFKPFRVGDYIEASGAEGTVKEISVFYTTLLTADNKKITIPNGNLMNANVTNYSSEHLRRVDLTFSTEPDTDTALVKDILRGAAENSRKVAENPEVSVKIAAYGGNSMDFVLRAWCASEDYWDVHFELLDHISRAFAENGVRAPAARMDIRLQEKA